MLAVAMALAVETAPAWQITHDAVTCRASTATPDGSAQITLVSRDVLTSIIRVELLSPAEPAWKTAGKADLKASAGETPLAAIAYTSQGRPDGRLTLSLSLPASMMAAMDPARAYTLSKGNQAEIALSGLPAAIGALKACRSDQLAQLAISPEEADDTVTDAVGTSSQWITNDDFPPHSGPLTTYHGYMIWRVDRDGRPSNCRFAQTTGNPSLDNFMCGLILKRGRYAKPAMDPQGIPMQKWSGRWMNVSL